MTRSGVTDAIRATVWRMGIDSWIAKDPEEADVAVMATTGPGLTSLANSADIDDVIALAYEGDGVFYVAADDAVADIDSDDGDHVVRLRRRRDDVVLLTWSVTSTWSALAKARGMFVWLLAEVDAEQWRGKALVEVQADDREGVFIVAVAR